ncbi:methyltransferase [Thermococcus sp. P6]|uniref:DUF3216 domain-containing protein n=1 Tax=Thermococcus sp. P6 TaxID=122420 RepID=UPI000B59A40C|nr:DUF3216 domain-containing protein [Thermococcus sp. P6]ASJ11084.1 methyltransferase [Thermococcus sp. P6]
MELPEVVEARKLLEDLKEGKLMERLDHFVRLNEGLESKKGKEFVEVSLLGFLEGMLLILRSRYPSDERVGRLYEKISERRRELDALFRRPRVPVLDDEP